MSPRRASKSSAPGGTLGSVGSFQLIERLPQSREVLEYLARQHGPGGFERICVLKVASRRRTDRRAVESLEREAKVMMRFDHPNIVRFHDFFEHEQDVVLVLEHFSGLTLARLLELLRGKGQELDERISWHVAQSLFEALAHAHGLVDGAGGHGPIIHRDVRPGSILVASDGRIRLTGFSAAQDPDAKEEITAFGTVVSVPSYLAPEQVSGVEATERSDAYAAALVVWELLTGRCATPEGLSEFDLLKRLSERQVEPLRALRPDIPALVTTALDLCLQRDPEERRIRCEEVAGCITAGLAASDGALALREAIAELGPAVEKLAGGRATSSPPSRRRQGSTPPLPHRPEAVTLPDRIRVSARMEAAVTAVPIEPRPVSSVPPEVPSSLFEESTAVMVPAPSSSAPPASSSAPVDKPASSPAPALVASTAPQAEPMAPGLADDDVSALHASRKRRQRLTLAFVGVPVAATVVLLVVALSGGFHGGTGDVGQPEAAPILATSVSPAPDETKKPELVEASAAPAESAPPSVPSDRAVLVVEAPPEGYVYVTGKSIGATGERIVTDCGQRFVRVGTRLGPKGLAQVRWLAKGQSVGLKCGQTTVVAGDPDRPKR